jgi:hypothetical protein
VCTGADFSDRPPKEPDLLSYRWNFTKRGYRTISTGELFCFCPWVSRRLSAAPDTVCCSFAAVDFKGARCFAPSDGKVPNQVSQKSVRIHLNKKWKKGLEGPKKGDKRGNKRNNEDQRGGLDKRQKTDDAPMDNRGANAWPKERPKHLRFTLFKENKDSHEAMGLVGKMLGVLPRAFGYAGTKDKRGVTVQHVTLHRVTAEKLAALNPRLFSIQVGNFT